MCGIAGRADFGRKDDRERALRVVAAMTDAIAHRGPDDAGLWQNPDGRITLGHRRLSILDLSPAGHNPMHSADGRWTITFNGEVYNFLELRAELEQHGYHFRTGTDTEVILAAFDKWGTRALDRFAGMFAFALWDNRDEKLYLVRDRLGKKPLYIAQYRNTLAFASELKALLVDDEFPRELDRTALSLYLRYGYVPAPHAIFSAAKKLLPGHYAVIDAHGLQTHPCWQPLEIAANATPYKTRQQARAALTDTLTTAVEQRLIADVPLGVFLSGGVDSSLIAAFAQKISDSPVRTFSIRFENKQYNEADYAAAVAAHLKTDHTEETCSATEMLSVVDRLPEIADEPFADSSVIPTYMVSRLARQHVTVALGGDGGDELFFGYPRYDAFARYRWLLGSPPVFRHSVARVLASTQRRSLRRASEILKQGEADLYARFVNWWSAAEVEQMTAAAMPLYPNYDNAQKRLQHLSLAERPPLIDLVTYLPEDILTKVDRASMATSLETRSPLLDHRFVEASFSVPLDMKWRAGTAKLILREILYEHVPRALIERPKMGFGVPLADWFRGPLRAQMEELLAGSTLEAVGIEAALPRKIWREFLAGRSHRTDVLWSTFALALWSQRWLAAQPALTIGAA